MINTDVMTATAMPTTPGRTVLRAPAGDIPSQHWQGGPVNCGVCDYADLRALPGRQGCEPGHACIQDVYARRIDSFFRWHPALGNEQIEHAYFEVRAIAARYASVFRLGRVADGAEVRVSKITTVILGILAIVLGIVFQKVNVAFMVGLAFAIAASANFPVLLLSMKWKGLTTWGAFFGGAPHNLSGELIGVGRKLLA